MVLTINGMMEKIPDPLDSLDDVIFVPEVRYHSLWKVPYVRLIVTGFQVTDLILHFPGERGKRTIRWEGPEHSKRWS